MNYKHFIFFIIFLYSCNTNVQKPNLPITNNLPDTTTTKPLPNYTIETVQGENGWGYNIMNNGKLFIRQPNIPAIPGNKGFENEEQAKKIANLVVHKLQNGMMPPSVTLAEIDSLLGQ